MQITGSRIGERGGKRDVGVFKELTGGDAADSVGGFDQIVAGAADVFVAEGVGKGERFGELTGAHQKARAVQVPTTLAGHDYLTGDIRW